MTWYDTAYRKLYFDFHSQETAVGLASAFDAERWADQVASAHAQAILVFCTCHFGWSYYRRGKLRYVHPHLPEGVDLVGDQIESLHRRGIKAIGYYHVLGSDPICRERPEWRQRDGKGKLVGNEICMQGPFLEAYFLPHVEEIVTNYPLDALFFDGLKANPECRCQSCRDRFSKEVGGEPPAEENDPQWARFVKWRLEDIRGIREMISDRIHRHRPEMIVSYNWSYTMRIPERVPRHVGALGADILPDDQMFNGSYDARGWATKARPFDVMNSAHLKGWWGDWGCKPATAMKHEVATAIANGGLTWIGYQMTHTFEVAPAVMAEMGKTLGFVKERESLLVDAEPRACVAVLHTEDAHFNRGAMLRVDSVSQRGAHKLLMETGLPHHFVDEAWLLSHTHERSSAERYPVIVLSDQRRLSDELVDAIRGYVKDGGGLLVTGRTGTLGADYEPTGDFALSELTGVSLTGQEVQPHCYLNVTDPDLVEERLPMPYLIDGTGLLVRSQANDVETLAELWRAYLRGDGKPLLSWSPPGESTGHPGITFRRVGKGAVSYIPFDIFHAYHAKNVWPLKRVVSSLIRKLSPDFPIRLESPAWLEVALSKQATASGSRTIVHLVNHHGNRPADGNDLCIEETLPVRDVVLTIRMEKKPEKVTLEPGGATPEWRHESGQVKIEIPEVEIHTAVVFEP